MFFQISEIILLHWTYHSLQEIQVPVFTPFRQ